jgi:hypothetical protein
MSSDSTVSSRCLELESELSARARRCFAVGEWRRWQKGFGVPVEDVIPRATERKLEHRVRLASAHNDRETAGNATRIIAPEELSRSAEAFGGGSGTFFDSV